LESRLDTAGIWQTIEVFNYTSGQYETVDTQPATLTDSIATVQITGDLGRLVNDLTGQVKSRLGWKAIGPTFFFPWTVRVDWASWNISSGAAPSPPGDDPSDGAASDRLASHFSAPVTNASESQPLVNFEFATSIARELKLRDHVIASEYGPKGTLDRFELSDLYDIDDRIEPSNDSDWVWPDTH
jgi:hypothetical protein